MDKRIMKTTIEVDKDYKIVKKEIRNEKPIPNKVLDNIIPILKKEGLNEP